MSSFEKCEKLINTAYNNRNPYEAAQALKMAAVIMRDLGINPSELLPKQPESNDLREAKKLAIHFSKKCDQYESIATRMDALNTHLLDKVQRFSSYSCELEHKLAKKESQLSKIQVALIASWGIVILLSFSVIHLWLS